MERDPEIVELLARSADLRERSKAAVRGGNTLADVLTDGENLRRLRAELDKLGAQESPPSESPGGAD